MKKALLIVPLLLVLVSCKKKNSDSLRYELNLNNAYTAILDSDSTVKKVTVPKKHNGKIIDTISGFRNNSYIEEVTFSNNITTIESGSFMFCENLKEINATSDIFKTISGSLYLDDYLIAYASGKTDSKVVIDNNLSSKAFTLAPNVKELKINSNVVEENAIYFLENLETVYLGENVKTISNNFQSGNYKLEKLVINNKTITENLDINNINRVYVLEDATLSTSFLENYEFRINGTYNNQTYKIYEVKK